MAEKKPTKREMFDKIEMICANNPEIVAFCQHEKELLVKKNASGSNSKANAENLEIIEVLLQELANIAKPITISELMNSSEVIKNYTYGKDNQHLSNQKISALLNKEVENKRVVKTVDKKKSYFSIVTD